MPSDVSSRHGLTPPDNVEHNFTMHEIPPLHRVGLDSSGIYSINVDVAIRLFFSHSVGARTLHRGFGSDGIARKKHLTRSVRRFLVNSNYGGNGKNCTGDLAWYGCTNCRTFAWRSVLALEEAQSGGELESIPNDSVLDRDKYRFRTIAHVQLLGDMIQMISGP